MKTHGWEGGIAHFRVHNTNPPFDEFSRWIGTLSLIAPFQALVMIFQGDKGGRKAEIVNDAREFCAQNNCLIMERWEEFS